MCARIIAVGEQDQHEETVGRRRPSVLATQTSAALPRPRQPAVESRQHRAAEPWRRSRQPRPFIRGEQRRQARHREALPQRRTGGRIAPERYTGFGQVANGAKAIPSTRKQEAPCTDRFASRPMSRAGIAGVRERERKLRRTPGRHCECWRTPISADPGGKPGRDHSGVATSLPASRGPSTGHSEAASVQNASRSARSSDERQREQRKRDPDQGNNPD